ncbi:protein MAINTENANCE OF PSII UNDER HIGH LIGHT 1 [Rutidosis leptorrhynchoides]|uniref:protein MAINTENANCE OF PSII UNDER HIGH LIGHT 1 n=1 Tax=Rutidosis leptorrhynchoides TaxID=125765 RepID=UPI003A98DDB2
MASSCGTTALSANSCSTNMRMHFFSAINRYRYSKNHQKQNLSFFRIRASSSDDQQQEDCNVEECAPEKEVGKVSVEWLAGEKTKVSGTFPPRRRDWSGYVEKDTAGQTNIYSVEPAVYVSESAISSGTSGTSADGSENTAALLAFGSILAIAAASSILFQVAKNPPQIQTLDYSGPSLSYYITKFKPSEVVQISVPTETEPSAQQETSSPDAVVSESEPSAQQETSNLDAVVTESEPSAQPEISVPQIDSQTAPSVSAEQPESITLQVLDVQVESG